MNIGFSPRTPMPTFRSLGKPVSVSPAFGMGPMQSPSYVQAVAALEAKLRENGFVPGVESWLCFGEYQHNGQVDVMIESQAGMAAVEKAFQDLGLPDGEPLEEGFDFFSRRSYPTKIFSSEARFVIRDWR